MNRCALITGSTGQDGSYLLELLCSKGVKVIATKRTSSRKDNALSDINPSYKYIVEEMDVEDPVAVNNVFSKYGSELTEVYHLAAFTHVGKSYYHPLSCINTNIKGTLNILEAVKTFCPDAFMYNAATSELFEGEPPKNGYNEKSHMEPKTPYGISKLAAYNLCKFYRSAFGIKVKQGILFNHESPRRGEDFVTQKIVTEMVKMHYLGHHKIQLGNLMARRDWGHAQDYVKAIEMICLDAANPNSPDTYVVATGITWNVADFVVNTYRTVFEDSDLTYDGIIEKVTTVNPDFVRSNEVWKLRGDASLINKHLGWVPTTTFNELVIDMVNHKLSQLLYLSIR